MEHQLITYSAEETMNLGQKFVALAKPGSTFCLTGDLGAGKTTLVRGIARALNIKSVVQSPTFNIMKVYFDGDRPLIHIDAYRLADVNPSPLAANHGGWFGNNHFTEANRYLREHGLSEINWLNN